MKVKDELRIIHKRVEKLKNKLQKAILGLPDNPNIQRLGGGAYSMNMSEIFKSKDMIMNASYYDFKTQHKKLCEIIEHTESTNVFNKLDEICKTGNIKIVSGRTSHLYKFHPDVLQKLEQVLKEV